MKRESNRNVKLANLSWGQYGYSKSLDGHSLGQQLQGNYVHLCVCTYADFPHIITEKLEIFCVQQRGIVKFWFFYKGVIYNH